MSDIAKDSQRGRRTLYLYFRSKKEIFNAVVSHELELLSIQQNKVAAKPIPPHEKLIQLIITHLESIDDIVMRNGTLEASFFKDIYRLERIRLKLDLSEQALIEKILLDGIQKNVFSVGDCHAYAIIIQQAVKGYEVAFINARRGYAKALEPDRMYKAITSLILRGIGYNGAIECNKNSFLPL